LFVVRLSSGDDHPTIAGDPLRWRPSAAPTPPAEAEGDPLAGFEDEVVGREGEVVGRVEDEWSAGWRARC